MGGHLAIILTNKVNRQGWIRSSLGAPRYKLEKPIVFDTLVTIDPVKTGLHSASVKNNVKKFTNYYQRKGCNGIFREKTTPHHPGPGWFGSVGDLVSRRIRGGSYSSAATTPHQVNVTVDRKWNYREGSPDINDPVYRMYGKDVNHDTLPWYVEDCYVDLLQ